MLYTLLANRRIATWKKIELHLLHLKSALLNKFLSHPLSPGQTFYSPGGTFKYRVVGACCRLYDRENLPHLCCSLEWRGKQPSWRRIGKRFVPDIAVKHSPSYCVGLVDYPEAEPFVMTLYWVKLSDVQQQWWYTKRVRSVAQAQMVSPQQQGQGVLMSLKSALILR
ncbi:MAG: hypothetical protein KME05_10155 [Gloeocapsa sp. UFS-A4-WI-NPMV-4B04]|jgi:hypothetical protein|nr:hypothetical protein [Gloeocapsa sp. UFS-A4-WI-NPMV-4B04]